MYSPVTTDHVGDSDSTIRGQQQQGKPIALHRCRFPDYTPSSITSLALTPTSFDADNLYPSSSKQTATTKTKTSAGSRGVLAVGRSNGTVQLMVWGGHQGWVNWRTLPSSFPPSQDGASSKKTTLLSHLTWTHQTTLSPSDVDLYSDDLAEAERELERLRRGRGLRLFGVGGVGSELIEWEWGQPTSSSSPSAVGMIKSTLPTLPPIFALAASPTSSTLAISCEDSTIRLINILDGELELVSKIELGGTGGKVRALSLAWGMPRRPEQEQDDDDDEKMDVDDDKPLVPAAYATPRESYILAGCSNSTIRRFDAPSSSSGAGPYRGTLRMTLDRLKGEHTVVWALTTLGDGTVVSGDSMGNVKFWDGEMGTQLQSFKGHKSDVLCLGVGTDGTAIFTSGIDQKTVEYRKVSVASNRASSSSSDSNHQRWIQSSGRRLHSHDVRAIVVSPPYEPYSSAPSSSSSSTRDGLVPVMTSAGLDLSLILTPVASSSSSSSLPPPSSSSSSSTTVSKRKQQQESMTMANPVSNNPGITFESTVHRRQAYVPQRSELPFSVTTRPDVVGPHAHGRLLLARRERSVGIWRLGVPVAQQSSSSPQSRGSQGWEKLLDLDFKLQTNLIASAISPNGQWFAVSDLYETKLYRLTVSRSGELVPRRQKTFVSTVASSISTSLGTGSGCIEFSTDSNTLFLSSAFGASVAVVDLSLSSSSSVDEAFKVVAVFGQGAREFNKKKGKQTTTTTTTTTTTNGKNGRISSDKEDDSSSDSDDDDDDSGAARADDSLCSGSTIVVVSASDDGKYLATANLDKVVEVYDLSSGRHLVTLPTSPDVPTAIKFVPQPRRTQPTTTTTTATTKKGVSGGRDDDEEEPTVVLAFSTNVFLMYGLESRRFHPWSLPLSSSKYNALTDLREPCLGISFEPSTTTTRGQRGGGGGGQETRVAVAWGANWVAKIDLDELRTTNFGIDSSSSSSTTRNGNHDDDKKNHKKDKKGGGGGRHDKTTTTRTAVPFRLEADRKRAREEDDMLPLVASSSSAARAVVDISVTRKFQPLFLFDFVQPCTTTTTTTTTDVSSSSSSSPNWAAPAELVAIERTWYDLAAELPDAFIATGQFGM